MRTGAGFETKARPGIGPEGLRWGASLILVLGLHAALVWVVLARRPPDMVLPSEPEAVMLELPPEPATLQPEAPPPAPTQAPAPVPTPVPPTSEPPPSEPPPSEQPVPEQPPEPPPPEPMPEPPPPPEIQATPPVPLPEAVLPLPPPPRIIPPTPPPPRPAPVRRAPPPALRPLRAAPAQPMAAAAPAAAPSPVVAPPPPPPPPSSPGNATLSWRSDLITKLARAKRYPEAARARGEQGTAMATFTMDRAGHVLSASLTRGSGSYLLDEEAVALIRRAEPLPALPAEMPGATLTLTVPIAFALR